MFAKDTRAPTIVNDNLVFDWTVVVKPWKEIGWIPVLVSGFPITIRPNNTGLVLIYLEKKEFNLSKQWHFKYKFSYYFNQFRHSFQTNKILSFKFVFLIFYIKWMKPFKQWMIQPKFHVSCLADCSGQVTCDKQQQLRAHWILHSKMSSSIILTDQISFGSNIHRVPIPRIFGRPQGIAFMMFAGQNNISVTKIMENQFHKNIGKFIHSRCDYLAPELFSMSAHCSGSKNSAVNMGPNSG